MSRKRLDLLLLERQLVNTRHRAQSLILAGQVLVNDVPVCKAGMAVDVDANIRLRGKLSSYVGRGGDKLAGALKVFAPQISGVVAIDVGSSTGGFTDCLLRHGAEKVYAVDVGYNQLAHSLRQDPRVVVYEKTHVKNLHLGMFAPSPVLAVIDVSFIGLRQILGHVISILSPGGEILALVKPQFELGPEYVSKGGVVREQAAQELAVEIVRQHGVSLGLEYLGNSASVLKGEKKGNQEYFIYFRK